MSDENSVMPDSSTLSHADEALDSQDTTQASEEDGTDQTVTDASTKETPSKRGEDSVLAKRLSDTETALKERQREFTEMSIKMAELRGQMNAMAQPETTEDPLAQVWDDKLKERYLTDPQEVMGEVLARQQRLFAQTLQQRDDYLKNELRTILSDELSPDRAELRETIKELSSTPGFSKLTPNEQVEIAKKFKGVSTHNTVTPHTTSMGGTGKRVSATGKTDAQVRKERAEADMQVSFSQISQDNKLMPEFSVDSRIKR